MFDTLRLSIEATWVLEFLKERRRKGISDGVWLALSGSTALVNDLAAHTLAGRFGKPGEDYELEQLYAAIRQALGTERAGSLTKNSIHRALGPEVGYVTLKEVSILNIKSQ